jgi:Right handed beta helix region
MDMPPAAPCLLPRFLWALAVLVTASCLALLVAVASAATALAAEIRIGPDDDLGAALSGLRAGDTLVLAPGSYALASAVDLSEAGTEDAPITVRSANGPDSVTITGGFPVHLVDGPFWRIEDLSWVDVPLRLIGEDAGGFDFHATIAGNVFTGQGVQLQNAAGVTITDNHFTDVRSRRAGVDRHAMHFVGASSDLVVSGNVVENAGADSIQAQGQVDDVLVEGNEFRVNRPYVADDQFCTTGENAIDIKRAQRWTIRDNNFHGFQVIPDCKRFDSTSEGGEAIVIHKHGARDFAITDNRFENNTVHVLIAGKTCIDGGTDCSGPLRTEGVLVEGNSFRNDDVPGQSTGVRVTPGEGIAQLEDPVGPLDVWIEANVFEQVPVVVDVMVRSFDTGGGKVFTAPAGVSVLDNLHLGGELRISPEADVVAAGNDAVDEPDQLRLPVPRTQTSQAQPDSGSGAEGSAGGSGEASGPDATGPASSQPAAGSGGTTDSGTEDGDQPASSATSAAALTETTGPATSAAGSASTATEDDDSSFPWALLGMFTLAAGVVAAGIVLVRARLLQRGSEG